MGGSGGGFLGTIGDIGKEINGKISELAIQLSTIVTIESERDSQINEIKKKAVQKITKHKANIELIGAEIYKLFKANYSLLTDGGRNRTIELALGRIGIRTNRPSAWAKNVEKVKEIFRSHGLERFIRIKQEEKLDRLAIANEPELFKGLKEISIIRKEVFFAKPNCTEEEYKKDLKKTRLN